MGFFVVCPCCKYWNVHCVHWLLTIRTLHFYLTNVSCCVRVFRIQNCVTQSLASYDEKKFARSRNFHCGIDRTMNGLFCEPRKMCYLLCETLKITLPVLVCVQHHVHNISTNNDYPSAGGMQTCGLLLCEPNCTACHRKRTAKPPSYIRHRCRWVPSPNRMLGPSGWA